MDDVARPESPGPTVRGAVATVARALGSPVRAAIVERLAQRSHFVEDLAAAVGQSVANTSQHLQRLAGAGLVVRRREGPRVRYALAGADVARLWTHLYQVAEHHDPGVERARDSWLARRDLAPPLSRAQVRALLRSCGPVVLDVRPAEEYAAAHLEGALSVPLDRLGDRLGALPPDRTILVHCRGPACTFAAEAATRLRAAGLDAHWTDLSVHDLHALRDGTA